MSKSFIFEKELLDNSKFIAALKELEIEPVLLEDESCLNKILFETNWSESFIVFQDFSGILFENLRKKQNGPKIFGPSVIINAALNKDHILPKSISGYPIYCEIFKKCCISATGLKTKEALQDLRRKVLYMGGTFLEKHGTQMTHLVAEKCRGEKYRQAVALGKPILKPDWINFAWEQRNEINFDANTLINTYKLQTFHACKIAFEGIDEVEKIKMIKLVEDNGGFVVEPTDPGATHIVKGKDIGSVSILGPKFKEALTPNKNTGNFDKLTSASGSEITHSPLKRPRFEPNVTNTMDENEKSIISQKDHPNERAKILNQDWFWSSIQIEACADETAYLIDNQANIEDTTIGSININSSITSPFLLSDADITPKSLTPSGRKRKRKELISSLSQVEYPQYYIEQTDKGAGNINLGGKSLDQSNAITDEMFASILNKANNYLNDNNNSNSLKSMTKRQQDFYQLLMTERNYLNILIGIIKHFKEPCEDNEDKRLGPILSTQEVKTIFGNMLPIYSIHRRLLREFVDIQGDWNEQNLIGKIFVDYAKEIQKCYERFVNSFESSKSEINRCESEKPRFLAKLRLATKIKEFGKQTLPELMIRPIQRLPSVELILKELLKHTPKQNPDYEWIEKGLAAIKEANKNINEKKRETESLVAMFEIFGEIEGCPAELISAGRSLLHKLDVVALNDITCSDSNHWQKNDPITLCVFSDHFQIVKRKGGGNKGISSAASVVNLKSPSISRKNIGPSNNNHNMHGQKRYKFIDWIYYAHVKRVVDISDLETPSFALVVRAPDEIRETILAFSLMMDERMWNKFNVLNLFAKLAGDAINRVDYGNLIALADSHSINLNESSSSNVLGRAAKFASKTRHKVGRALSLSGRTPNRLKRTFSQMISPFNARSIHEDSISQTSSNSVSTTPLRNNMSSLSLLFGTRRGTMDPPSTPKTPRTKLTDKTFEKIQEM